ncbi:MAG TPA: AMP-binding protein [Pseudonocardiaceae bacterium]|nr:AMP-binding protein [Pseudonocardiaceae bacterium]
MLAERTIDFDDRQAVVFDGTATNYRELLRLVEDWSRVLDQYGIRAGDVVALDARYSPTACAALLALAGRKAIIVPLDAPPRTKLAEFFDVAKVEFAITIEADGARRVLRRATGADHPLYQQLRVDGRAGLVLFSADQGVRQGDEPAVGGPDRHRVLDQRHPG